MKKYTEMTQSQKNAALILLGKYFADITAQEVKDYCQGNTSLDVICDPEELDDVLQVVLPDNHIVIDLDDLAYELTECYPSMNNWTDTLMETLNARYNFEVKVIERVKHLKKFLKEK